MTYYQVFRGNETMFPDKNLPIKLWDIADLPSQTMMIVEAAEPVHWTQPADIPFQLNQADLMKRIGNHWDNDTFHAAMGDFAVCSFPRAMPALTLQALVTPGGVDMVHLER